MIRRVRIGLLVVGLCFVSGCASDPSRGYTFATTFDDSIESIHIPTFTNDTFWHDIEFELTDAIVKEVRTRTPWRVTTADRAETVLEGEITSVELRKLSTARSSGLAQELGVVLRLDFELRRNDGSVVVERRNFSATEVFVPSLGVQERIEQGQDAVVQEVAQDLVAELRSNW